MRRLVGDILDYAVLRRAIDRADRHSARFSRASRFAVLADGFAWNGKTYPSLSRVAFAITGTRWNGPKFFGLREKLPKAFSP